MLQIGDVKIDPKAIIFDKDGTLMAFWVIWNAWYGNLLQALSERVTWSDALQQGFFDNLGVNSETGLWDPLGPLTLASTREVGILVAGQIYQHTNCGWPEALQVAKYAEAVSRTTLDNPAFVQPVGDLVSLLTSLRDAGYRMAVATTDDRENTERNLDMLEIMGFFEGWICGDDPVPLKPAPDMVLRLCDEMGVATEEVVVVGDTIADMDMARAAGCALAVGVGSGALTADILAPHADVMLSDVHSIRIVEG